MPIYKSTLIKFLKSFSTWFPLGMTLIIVALIGAILPFLFLDLQAPSIIQTYKLYIVASVTTIGSATAIISATFAAYKSVQIYKQEIEEGTFLVLVSKPINRKRIIFEKWLALFTIISFYVIILISFYIFLVLLIDPGDRIPNLNIPPIKDKIFIVGLILMAIVLVLTLLFSSIALILSSKISSSATIALVAGLGAIIPITGLIPTFTNKQPQTMITNPINILNTSTIPRDQTINFIENIIDNPELNKKNILTLFQEVDFHYDKIENDTENKYVNNLGVSSGEWDVYNNLFWLDFNYQLSSIATIASDLLISKQDSNSIASAAMIGGFTQSPTLSGKVKITTENIPINELSTMLLNTLQEYDSITQSTAYGSAIFPFLDYILAEYNVVFEKTTNNNFNINLKTLFAAIGPKNYETFLSSPITQTILKDKNVSEDLKKQLQNKNNPYWGEIHAIEALLLMRISLETGLGLNLIIADQFVNNFYNKNEINKFIDINAASAYLSQFATPDNALTMIINDYCKIDNLVYNPKAIIQLANTIMLTEKAKNGLNSFVFEDYANKWILFGIYISITFILLPTSYLIIKKQDIR